MEIMQWAVCHVARGRRGGRLGVDRLRGKGYKIMCHPRRPTLALRKPPCPFPFIFHDYNSFS